MLLPLLLTGTIWFVDGSATGANDGTSWANAFTDLQDGLATPWSLTDQIWVAAGTYKPSQKDDRAASFRLQRKRIYGGFDGTETSLDQRAGLFDQTILSGDLQGDDGPDFANRQDNSFHVVVLEIGHTELDGLTIRGGHADSSGSDASGGGLTGDHPGGLEVRDCRFVDNYARELGGGVHYDSPYDGSFRRCLFLGNESGTEGGAVWSVSIIDETKFDRCRFLGNRSRAGGAFGGGGASFHGCAFSGNRARGGAGGAILSIVYVEAVGCTFYGNTASGGNASQNLIGGGAIRALCAWGEVVGMRIENSIFWQNADDEGEGFVSQIKIGPYAPFIPLRNSCVPEFHPTGRGRGNLRTDPELVLPLGADGVAGTLDDDLRLRAGSPCVDRGDDAIVADLGPVDLAGRDRTVDALACGDGGVVDIGAYESQVVLGTTNYCEASPSSRRVPAILAGPCGFDTDDGDLPLSAGPVPHGGGYFVFGPDRALTPLGNGLLCVGGELHRTPFVATQGGALAANVEISDPRIESLLLPGTSWCFQAIFRDPAAGGAGFNLSDAIRITFR